MKDSPTPRIEEGPIVIGKFIVLEEGVLAFIKKFAGAILAVIFGRGVLAALHQLGYFPEQLVGRFLAGLITNAPYAFSEETIWIASLFIGGILLIVWHYFHIGVRIGQLRRSFLGRGSERSNGFPIYFCDCPEQGADEASDPLISWLHLEIRNIETEKIEDCGAKIHLEINDGAGRKIEIRDLHWRSSANEQGDPRKTLYPGRKEVLPIIARNNPKNTEKVDRFGNGMIARITDYEWLRGHAPRYLQIGTGTHRFKITIHTGTESWESPYYALRVPGPNSDNGHFWFRKEP